MRGSGSCGLCRAIELCFMGCGRERVWRAKELCLRFGGD